MHAFDDIKVSEHGRQRARERLGIPRRAIKRMAALARRHGKGRAYFRGDLRRYLESCSQGGAVRQDVRVYGGFIYIFGMDGTFVTCWPVPRVFQQAVARCDR